MTNSSIVVCEKCTLPFFTVDAFDNHECVPLSEQERYTCQTCGPVFGVSGDHPAEGHLEGHKCRHRYPCSVCNADYAKGLKKDQGKLRWSLLPEGTVTAVLKVLEFGATKYSVDNWQHVEDHTRRYYDAAMRHIEAWRYDGENDNESGLPHLAHAVCCLLFLMWFDNQEVK